MSNQFAVLERLTALLHDRHLQRPRGSYAATLLSGGVESIAAKLREETVEVIEAAANLRASGAEHLVHEAADLLFHLMLMLELCDASLADVARELEKREGIGGLEEKRSRG